MKKELIEGCIARGLSIHKMADELGVCFTSIRHWLKKHNLVTQVSKPSKEYLCKCGETDGNKFYQKSKTCCKKCHNDRLMSAWRNNKVKAVDHKGGKCMRCGYNKYIGALEFHHRDPTTKECAWDAMCRWTWARIVEEINKCDLLCANCHREVHEEIRADCP